MESTQQSVYLEVSQLVTSVMDGYNVCIFAYGQTGSGKTWTMSGPPDDRGVNTRALDELFTKAGKRSAEFVDTITLSILEVYNEDIHDLLVDSKHAEKLEVRQAENGIHVPGLTLVAVQNLNHVFEYLQIGTFFLPSNPPPPRSLYRDCPSNQPLPPTFPPAINNYNRSGQTPITDEHQYERTLLPFSHDAHHSGPVREHHFWRYHQRKAESRGFGR